MPTPSTTGHRSTTRLRNRYQLFEPLGTGSMGQIFRAYDQLTRQTVALKRVFFASLQPANLEFRLALTREFQVLATLRHPHVIAVQDYGFDEEQRPYFTMELLAQAHPITKAAQFLTETARIDLLVQLLQALVYVHRQGIVHRDIKPGNVLVSQRGVKLLDFGLATSQDAATPPSGTLSYMAPELLQGEPASASSDLFSVGVIAYELFAGWHPFAQTGTVAEAMQAHAPDFTFLALEPAVTAVLQTLLAPLPNQRYPDALAAIHALCQAADQPLPPESKATRDSFLQAAPFIGREVELDRLKMSLERARQGRGTTWLVRGESGIGKTRLLQELKTFALVDGYLVLRGQARPEGNAYHLWPDALRQLVLVVRPGGLERAVLQPLIPDIGELLQKPVPPLPPLAAKAAQTRLTLTVVDLIQQAAARQAILLILEDLHWADDNSLFLLQAVANLSANQAVCLVGSYRPGERPLLGERFPGSQTLALPRLNEQQLGKLSAAMLGENGREAGLLAFLQKETEGNTFFLVELLRTLAEEMGGLNQITAAAMPAAVFPGGVQQIIQRRLERIPQTDRPLLQLTAVAGRQLDLPLLAHLAPEMDIEMWLTSGVHAAVLARSEDGNGWQFGHDKLREALLQQMSHQERQKLHAQIGQGIETVYADQLSGQYGRLAHHFAAANQTDQQRHYLHLAASEASSIYANELAQSYYQQLLPLEPTAAAKAKLYLQIAQIGRRTGEWEEAEAALKEAFQLAEAAAERTLQTEVIAALGGLARMRSKYDEAQNWLNQAVAHYRAEDQQTGLCHALVELANVYYQRGGYQQAGEYLAEAMIAAKASGNPKNVALVQHNLGSIAYSQGDWATAVTHYEAARQLREAENDLAELANSYNNLGLTAYRQGNFSAAQRYQQKGLAIRRKLGDRWGVAASLSNLGMIPYQQRDYATAQAYWEEALQIRRQLGEEWSLAGSLDNLALVAMGQGRLDAANELLAQAVALRQKLNDRQGLAISLGNWGRLALAEQAWPTAVGRFRRSLQLAHEIGDPLGVVFALVGVAAAWIHTGSIRQAVELLAAAENQLEAINGVWETDEEALFEASREQAQAALQNGLFEKSWQLGRALELDQAVKAALEG